MAVYDRTGDLFVDNYWKAICRRLGELGGLGRGRIHEMISPLVTLSDGVINYVSVTRRELSGMLPDVPDLTIVVPEGLYDEINEKLGDLARTCRTGLSVKLVKGYELARESFGIDPKQGVTNDLLTRYGLKPSEDVTLKPSASN